MRETRVNEISNWEKRGNYYNTFRMFPKSHSLLNLHERPYICFITKTLNVYLLPQCFNVETCVLGILNIKHIKPSYWITTFLCFAYHMSYCRLLQLSFKLSKPKCTAA